MDSSSTTDPASTSSAAQANPGCHALDNLTMDELKEWIASNNIGGQVKQHKKAGEPVLTYLLDQYSCLDLLSMICSAPESQQPSSDAVIAIVSKVKLIV